MERGKMSKKSLQSAITADSLQEYIYIIRGQKVMLDRDLAAIYGYETRTFNQQVKNNEEKFGGEFRFQLTRKELEEVMMSKFLISRKNTMFQGNIGGVRKLPYAFTESGVYMLMTVLRGELATKQSIALIKMFKQMKDALMENQALVTAYQFEQLSKRVDQVEHQLTTQIVDKEQLQEFIKNFTDDHIGREWLVLEGQMVEAAVAYQQICEQAKQTVWVIDNYVSVKTLWLIRHVSAGVSITIYSGNLNGSLKSGEVMNFQQEYPQLNLHVRRISGRIHDRLIVLDFDSASEQIYICGGSIKDAGRKVTTIIKVHNTNIYHQWLTRL